MLRHSPRALALRAAALVVAVVTTAVVTSDLAALHRRSGDLGTERGVVVAARDLAVGDTVERSGITIRRVYESQLPDDVVHAAHDAIGRVVVLPVLRGNFIAGRALAPRHRTGLDGIVPEAMRAIRVTVSGSLRPRTGAAVDVLASFDARADGTSGTIVVAAGVTVLGTDRRATGGTGRGDALGVTLLVDPDEAASLADAQVNGVLTLALVPPEEAAAMPGPTR
jgi:Flp pilus assembly protein CpaB